MPGNAGEGNVAIGVMRIADRQANKVATFNRCRKEIPSTVNLTAADLAPSHTRPGEPMWHQIVRNIKSHDVAGTNYIMQGYLTHIPGTGYRITPAGEAHLRGLGY
jgi:hypothetical protein